MKQTLSRMFRVARLGALLPAAFFFISHLSAQPAEPRIPGRWLLIFDTSADMKRRVPAVQTEVNTLLALGLGGRLQAGDSIGVWTFDETLRTGEMPLIYWAPEDAATIAASINKFVGKQRYENRTRFAALQPLLNRVAQSSPRLTVLIFCDGDGAFTGTPYDDGVNRIFRQRLAEQKKARQPFVVVLRSQLGQYVGCTVNFPPGMVNVPDFPPLPPPPATNAAPPPLPPPAPPPTAPPLVIVGTNVESGAPPALSKAAPVMETNVVAAVPTNAIAPAPAETSTKPAAPVNFAEATVEATPSNAPPKPPSPAESAGETNLVSSPAPASARAETPTTQTNPIEPANAAAQTKGLAAPAEHAGSSRWTALAVGAGMLLVAGAVAAFAVFRARRADRGSLITRTMNRK